MMDKDNFGFCIGDHLVDMTNGELTVDGTGYDPDDPAKTYDYAMARRVAFECGCYNEDEGVPSVVWNPR